MIHDVTIQCPLDRCGNNHKCGTCLAALDRGFLAIESVKAVKQETPYSDGWRVIVNPASKATRENPPGFSVRHGWFDGRERGDGVVHFFDSEEKPNE